MIDIPDYIISLFCEIFKALVIGGGKWYNISDDILIIRRDFIYAAA